MAKKLSPWCKKAKIEMIRKDISVKELAEAVGCTRTYASSTLNGRITCLSIRKKISDFLNISDSDDEE